jgi:hypothetical protein
MTAVFIFGPIAFLFGLLAWASCVAAKQTDEHIDREQYDHPIKERTP